MDVDFTKLIKDLRRDEGVRYKPYKDTEGILTIGIGTNLDAGLDDTEVDFLCRHRASKVLEQMGYRWPWMFTQLNEPRLRVMTNMAYNLGVDGLASFKNTLQALQDQRYDDAAKAILDSKYAKQVGKRAERIAYAIKNGVTIEIN